MLGGCDIRVACPEAKFAVMEPKRGLFAGGGTTVRLPRQIPWPQAMEFLLCADLDPRRARVRDGAAQRGRPARPAARQGARVRGAHHRQRAARGAGDEAERAAGPLLRRGRDHAAQLRAAVRSSRSRDARRPHGADPAASGRGARRARQGAAHAVREGEPHLERDLPDRGRQGRSARRSPRSARRSGRRGDATSTSIRARRASSASRRTRGIPTTSATAARPSRSTMWEQVARAAAARRRAARRCSTQLDSIQIVYCQTWQYDDAVARLAGPARRRPAAPPLLGHRRHDDAAARRTATAERCSRGELDLALITSAEALATQRAYKKRGERFAVLVHARRRSAPFPWESPPDPVEVAHEVFQAWLTFAVFDNARRAPPRRRRSTTTAPAIGEMLAPMTEVAAAQPARVVPHRARRVDEIVEPRARQPHGRLPVHEVHGVGHGRRHGRRAGRRDARARRRARRPGRPARLPPRLVLRDAIRCSSPSTPTCARSPAMARRSRGGARASPASASTTSRTSTSTRASPSSLHFACDALGHRADDPRGLTVTGGLPYHGGPASGYLTHSIAAMVERLRADPRRARPGQRRRHAHDEARVRRVLDARRARSCRPTRPRCSGRAARTARVVAEHDGDATVAAYSVVHGRDGEPEWALLVCDLADGARTYAQVRRRRAVRRGRATSSSARSVTLRTARPSTGPARNRVRVNRSRPGSDAAA